MTTTVEQDTRTDRDRHCDALQALVDLLRAHPDLESPFDSHWHGKTLLAIGHRDDVKQQMAIGYRDDVKQQMAAWARATTETVETVRWECAPLLAVAE